MGGLSPLFLAWSHLRHKPRELLGSVLLLSVCLTLLYTQVGLYLAAGAAAGALADTGPDSAAWRMPLVRGFLVGAAGMFLLLLLLLHHVILPTVASQQRDFALLFRLGYSPGYLRSVVIAEALLLVLLSCVPAVLVLPAVYAIVRAVTELPLALGWRYLGWLTLVTLVLAAVVALRGCRRIKAVREGEHWEPGDLM